MYVDNKPAFIWAFAAAVPLEQAARIAIVDDFGQTIQPTIRNHQIAIHSDVDLADE